MATSKILKKSYFHIESNDAGFLFSTLALKCKHLKNLIISGHKFLFTVFNDKEGTSSIHIFRLFRLYLLFHPLYFHSLLQLFPFFMPN